MRWGGFRARNLNWPTAVPTKQVVNRKGWCTQRMVYPQGGVPKGWLTFFEDEPCERSKHGPHSPDAGGVIHDVLHQGHRHISARHVSGGRRRGDPVGEGEGSEGAPGPEALERALDGGHVDMNEDERQAQGGRARPEEDGLGEGGGEEGEEGGEGGGGRGVGEGRGEEGGEGAEEEGQGDDVEAGSVQKHLSQKGVTQEEGSTGQCGEMWVSQVSHSRGTHVLSMDVYNAFVILRDGGTAEGAYTLTQVSAMDPGSE